MSIKFTQSEIKKIIQEEIQNVILEALDPSDVKNLLNMVRKFSDSSRKFSKPMIDLAQKIAANLDDLSKFKNADDIDALIRNLQDMAAKPGIANNPRTKAQVDQLISRLERASLKVKQSAAFKTKAKVGAGVVGVGAGGTLMSMDPDDIAQGADASQLQSLPPEDLASFPQDDEVNMSLPPEEESPAAGGESAKARRTRIAHAAVKSPEGKKKSVGIIQFKLKQLGYDLGTFGPFGDGIDEDYGPITVKAVKAFQKKNGLTADGIVGRNTWAKLSADDAIRASIEKTKDRIANDDGSLAVAKMGADALSKLEAMDANSETLRRVYERTSRSLERALRRQGVSGRGANTTLRRFLPIITPDAYGNDMQSVKDQKIMRLKRVLSKGINVAMGGKDISLGQEVVIDALEDALRREGALQESKSYDIKFNKWSKLWS